MENIKKIIKYSSIFLLIVFIMTVITLEMNFEIISYLITFGLVSGIISFLYFKHYNMNKRFILLIIIVSFFSTWFLSTLIIMRETDMAYSKITTIPKDSLLEFYKTHDINLIPPDRRHAWIGVLYREINIVTKNRIREIKAVGWGGYQVFAYYNIEEDNYYGSYH